MLALVPFIALSVQGTQAISFSSWVGLACRGQQLTKDMRMYPYACTFAGLLASSIKASGLENSNNPTSYIELYSDSECKQHVYTVKYSDTCYESNFQAAKLFIPAAETVEESDLGAREETMADLRYAPLHVLTPQQETAFGMELEEALLLIEKEFLPVGEQPEEPSHPYARPRLGMSLLPTRAKGDRHVSETDPSITGVEVEDDNVPGDRNGFQFDNPEQRMSWAMTTFRRLLAIRSADPGRREYMGSQTVGNHDLDVDIEMRSGTLGSNAMSSFRQWIAMFARQRDNHAHQVWELLQNGQVLAIITLKAYRNGNG